MSSRKWRGPLEGREGVGVMSLEASAVDCSGPWLVWAREPGAGLAESLEAQGQLAPVLVARDEGGWVLVAGYQRLRALAHLNRQVAAVEVEAQEAERCLLYLADNQGRGAETFSAAMQCQALAYLRPRMDGANLAIRAAPLLGLEPESRRWRWLLGWLDLDQPDDAPEGEPGDQPAFWLDCLAQERVDLSCGELLAKFSAEERRVLEPFFRDLRWSRSAGREFLRDLYETCRARQTGLADLLQEPSLARTLETALSPKDKVQWLLDAGRTLRRPGLAKLRQDFEAQARVLEESGAWRVEPSQGFEADAVHLSRRVAGRADLDKARAELEAMARSPQWERLWSLAHADEGPAPEANDAEDVGDAGEEKGS